jgi:hypothetical protein
VAESDSDTKLGLEHINLCHYRTPTKQSKQKMDNNPSRQMNSDDDSAEIKWSPTPDVPVRRYYY